MTESDGIGMRIKPGVIVSGPFVPEPIEILAIVPLGASLKVIGRGTKTGLTHDPLLSRAQIDRLSISATREPFDGAAALFRTDVEAYRLGSGAGDVQPL
jgi:hypothetical protein